MDKDYTITIIPLERSFFAIIEWQDGSSFGFNAITELIAREQAENIARSKLQT
jgi:hypothetical protein